MCSSISNYIIERVAYLSSFPFPLVVIVCVREHDRVGYDAKRAEYRADNRIPERKTRNKPSREDEE